MATLKGEGRLYMDSSAPTEPRVIASGVTLDPNSITNEELAEWLKLTQKWNPEGHGATRNIKEPAQQLSGIDPQS